MKENSMEKQNFIDFIKLELDKPIPVNDAIQKMADYHKATPESIKRAFFNLGHAEESDVATFSETVNSSAPCISVRISDQNGGWKSNEKINQWSGQPMATVG